MAGSQRFCVGCGRELGPGLRFCTGCGRSAGEDSGPATLPGQEQASGAAATMTTAAPVPPAPWPPTQPPAPAGPQPPVWPASPAPWPTPEVTGGPAPAGPDSWATPEVTGGPALGGPDDDLDPSTGPWWRDELPGRDKEGRWIAPLRRSRWLLLLGLAAVVVAGAIAVVVLHPFSHSGAVAGAAGATPHTGRRSPSATGAPSPALSQQQAARNLAALLGLSVADRRSVVNAVADVSRCGPRLSQDLRVFRDAAASRQRLLSRLGSLPGRSTLPAPLLQSLTSAWQASAAADRDYAGWARDESSRRCTRRYQTDPGYRAAIGPDSRATTAKKAFASRWDAIATRYGLRSFQWDQL